MKAILFILLFSLVSIATYSQNLYVKTYGSKNGKPLLFLHGGPGYNSALFEATTAKVLTEKGYFVVVYDRRGEGRSAQAKPSANFTFKETFDDINDLLKNFSTQKVTLVGHSFGGVIAAMYANQYPEKIQKTVLISTPISMQETFRTILTNSKRIYEARKDTINLHYLGLIQQMDTASIAYSSYTFMHAMQNGFYTTKTPDAASQTIYSRFAKDSLFKYASQLSQEAPLGFSKNEHYTTIDLTKTLRSLKDKNASIIAFYGKQDGLFSPQQIEWTEHVLGRKNVIYLENCSHNLFVDQQKDFLSRL